MKKDYSSIPSINIATGWFDDKARNFDVAKKAIHRNMRKEDLSKYKLKSGSTSEDFKVHKDEYRGEENLIEQFKKIF